jgi:hypothetical protein
VTLFAGHDLACQRGERLVFAGLSFRVAAGGALLLARTQRQRQVEPAALHGRPVDAHRRH